MSKRRIVQPSKCRAVESVLALTLRRLHVLAFSVLGSALLPALAGCVSPSEQARLLRENQALRLERDRLERTTTARDGTIARLRRQITNLQSFDPARPVNLFAPVKIEIASLSGGADFDGEPGDDGVVVYLRPRDADGDVVKVPGRITIQLIDNSRLASPRVLGVYHFDQPEQLRKLWHGRFATNHYTLKCPLPPDSRPRTRRVTVSAEFVDYLTGEVLTAVKEVPLSFPEQ